MMICCKTIPTQGSVSCVQQHQHGTEPGSSRTWLAKKRCSTLAILTCNTICEHSWLEKTHRCAQPSPGSISRAALDGSDPLALEAVDMFLAILGCEAGFMGLRLLATGGVYICGGIGPKVGLGSGFG